MISDERLACIAKHAKDFLSVASLHEIVDICEELRMRRENPLQNLVDSAPSGKVPVPTLKDTKFMAYFWSRVKKHMDAGLTLKEAIAKCVCNNNH